MYRRQFLAGTLATGVLPAMAWAAAAPRQRLLVLVELNGGNDGLNTVVPFTDPLYRKLRPSIALAADQVVRLDEKTALHPALAPLMGLWRRGQLAIAQGVGYPDPNLSHFRSIDIWETASNSDDTKLSGWIPQAMQGRITAGFPAEGIYLGRNDPGPLFGAGFRSISLGNPERTAKMAARPAPASPSNRTALSHILTVQNQVNRTVERLRDLKIDTVELPTDFPKGKFAASLRTAARLIVAGVTVPVIKTSIGSFDTHAGQAATHNRLLAEMAAGLVAFQRTLDAVGRWDDVLIMTYSEFGRRPKENGSRGTDHGTAAPHFLLGGRIRGGLYGQAPDLAALAGGNLRYGLHFRALYSTAARDWMGWDAPWSEPALDCLRV